MLRNLNREYARGRICGTNKSGVLGSAVPSSGDNGAGYAYSSLSLPADTDNEYQGYITSVPAGLTIFGYEDTSFIASANDGSYIVPWELYENGVLIGDTTFTLTFGDGVVVSCLVGNTSANGSNANINQQLVISSLVGNAIANGSAASVQQGNVISVTVGDVTASGSTATIALNVTIPAEVGNTVANGNTAGVVQGFTVVCTVGNSAADGSVADVSVVSAYSLSSKRTVVLKRTSKRVVA